MRRKGFWIRTQRAGVAHVQGDPNMSAETQAAVDRVIDAALQAWSLTDIWRFEGKFRQEDVKWVPLSAGGEEMVRLQYGRAVEEDRGGVYRLLNSDGDVVETTETIGNESNG